MQIREKIKSNTSFDEKTNLTWINQILVGLDYLHSKKFIHRDIKPR